MKKIMLAGVGVLLATMVNAAPVMTNSNDLSAQPYLSANYDFVQINYKSTDSITGASTSNLPTSSSSPAIAFGFPVNPRINVEIGYLFPTSVTSSDNVYHITHSVAYAAVLGHYSFANNFALLYGAGPSLSVLSNSYVRINNKNTPYNASLLDLALTAGAQYFFTSNLGVKAMVNYGIFKSENRNSTIAESIGLVYLV
jgi:hypothetical protein